MLSNIKKILGSNAESKPLRVIECLAGNNPLAALLMVSAYGEDLDYQSVDLVDHSDLYFKQADDLSSKFGIDMQQFREKVRYKSGFNIFDDGFEKLGASEIDVILHWGYGLAHILPLRGDMANQYIDIRREEAQGIEHKSKDEVKKRHFKVRNRIQTEMGLTKGEYWTNSKQLKQYITRCTKLLKENGILITSTMHDFKRISGTMQELGMEYKQCEILCPNYNLSNERKITVWRSSN